MGRVFNIQRFSIYDGPGIRTAVFFAGCNLKCLWCHNPESIPSKQQLQYNADSCILCGKCAVLCKNNAHSFDGDNTHIFERSRCVTCMKCVSECYAEALVPVYRELDAAQLEKSILTDEPYFKQSGGGVTFTGGEPMLQLEFLLEILKRCKNRGIHTAVDTAGAVDFTNFEKILPYCDLFLYDIKAADNDLHKKLTGVTNIQILENLTRLSSLENTQIWVRVPVIPNANVDDMSDIAKFLRPFNIQKCELMPYHKLGEGKYKSLGIDEKYTFDTPSDELMDDIRNLFKKIGVNV